MLVNAPLKPPHPREGESLVCSTAWPLILQTLISQDRWPWAGCCGFVAPPELTALLVSLEGTPVAGSDWWQGRGMAEVLGPVEEDREGPAEVQTNSGFADLP